MIEIPYSHESPAAVPLVITLGKFAVRAYRGTPPPDPDDALIIRPTHDIGKVTANRRTSGKSPSSFKQKVCDHSKHKPWVHDGIRVRCSGCRGIYRQNSEGLPK